jgi:ADP-heptose:LPS heptosyltransferase
LLIRFSSFGDIVQAVGVPSAFRTHFPGSQVDWLVREDFKSLLEGHPSIEKVLSFERSEGLVGLIRWAWALAGTHKYTHVYDAHNNLRSQIFSLVFRLRSPWVQFVRRPKHRLRRFLYFQLGLPTLQMPFRGANSFHKPLGKWGMPEKVATGRHFFSKELLSEAVLQDLSRLRRPLVAVAPSAAWEMKRWPIHHWKTLVQSNPDISFVLLGGPQDQFINEIYSCAPDHSLNLAGRLSLAQNAAIFEMADLVIANDTGLLHVADQMERPTFALIGPTAFGYPSHATSRSLEIDLSCKPCSKDGRGGCKNSIYQRCLVELSPERVANEAREVLQKAKPQ